MIRRSRSRYVLLFVAALLALPSCRDGSMFPGDNEIDPPAHLKRSDYIHLRQRENLASSEAITPIPPIPDMSSEPAAVAPAKPGGGKLVSINVTDSVPLRDVLVELAREAKVNLELDPRVEGGIIFSAHNQPFDVVLRRICNLAGLRATTDDAFIRIEPDTPYQQTYQLDYLSLARKATSQMEISTNVFDTDISGGGVNGVSGGTGSTGSRNSGDNNSSSKISATSDTDFWREVDKSLAQIIATSGQDSKKSGTSYSIDRQTGMVTVFGNGRQQAAVDTYFKKLKRKAYAQVLIDARVIEVELNEDFQSGIDWRTLFGGAFNAAADFGAQAAGPPFTTAATATQGVFTGAVTTSDFAGILNLVRTFGTTRVLSAPRITVLNNQTAVLKVATNQVYFITQAQFTTVTNANGSAVTTTPVYSSTPHTVPVGLVMTVQPAIDTEHDRVTMTLRPTISRVVGQANDPSIGLNAAQAGVTDPVVSQIPILAVREMDSVLQLRSGEIGVMGGLMQDSSTNTDTGIPPFDTLPVIGNLAKSRDNQARTSELVVLIRATITDNAPPEAADRDLYHTYNTDPRPLPVAPVALSEIRDTDDPLILSEPF
ncbi:MAG: secretin N-terminal domain-containing protein [Bdellovibrionales bacterium]